MSPVSPDRRFRALRHLVGNTPLLAIECLLHDRPCRVYAKAEHLNMTGSIKDRMGLHVLDRAYERGDLVPGQPLAEASSGNTGISLAALGRALGHPVTIFMPSWMSAERVDLIKSFGAAVRLVTRDEGGFLGCIAMAEELAEREGAFLPRQFENAENVVAHEESTGPELWWQLRYEGLTLDAFVAGVGTGGTVMGVGRFLRRQSPGTRVHPLEPSNSPTLRTGHKVGCHRIQGISDEFIPPIIDLAFLDDVVEVDDGDAILMAQRLAADLGLGVGISSGANFLGALLLAAELGPEATVATVFPDDSKKYLSTDLMRDEPVRPSHVTPQVELVGFTVLKRVCLLCCEGETCERRLHRAELLAEVREGAFRDGDLPFCMRPVVERSPSEKGGRA